MARSIGMCATPSLFIDPAVGCQLAVFVFDKFAKLGALAFFEARLWEHFCVFVGDSAGIGFRSDHGTHRGLIRMVIRVEDVIHPEDDDIDPARNTIRPMKE